ncbi:TnsD family Tn7-like transposition protein [Serratia proteamaculans]|uniref:Transcriptional antiterminator n=1 Tax=Serratia proteamaculans TaxID=28151 RepID=A0A5Q2VD87_SERPR|nr:TnsD family Tn7-like transposition protein [Serratia proteamaculans]QGH61343.1 transcriptional antiterminator [Serratia proteamaculans]
MLNFPIPYPEELIYSTIARYGVRMGVISPKQLLEALFGNRSVIATLDLPNGLCAIQRALSRTRRVEPLIYQHTLFPLYAPFIPECRRQQCILWMSEERRSSVHLTTGMAASSIGTPVFIRYCPGCQKEHHQHYGEYFWRREWQVTGIECCPEHGLLANTTIRRPLKERHRFIEASPANCPQVSQMRRETVSDRVTYQIRQLLMAGSGPSANRHQWTGYYRGLARNNVLFLNASHLDHPAIYDRVLSVWSEPWLRHYGIHTERDDASSWLRAIFRKHRRSFSYLQHIVVNQAILGGTWRIGDVLANVGYYPASPPGKATLVSIPQPTVLSPDQQQWSILLTHSSPKSARNQLPALYARLYRNQRLWLLAENQKCNVVSPVVLSTRIDWAQRDTEYAERLGQLQRFFAANPLGVRRSRSLYLKALPHCATVEKNLHRLPRVVDFLFAHPETVGQYQIRRLDNAYAQLSAENLQPLRWRWLRAAGLSEARLTAAARLYLRRLLDDEDKRHHQ